MEVTMLTDNENNHSQPDRNYSHDQEVKCVEVTIPVQDVSLIHCIARILCEDGAEAHLLRQQVRKAPGEKSKRTGADLIAFFRNSPLTEIALELERDRA